MDRIDVRVALSRPTLADLQFGSTYAESTAVVAARVLAARERAGARLDQTPWVINNDVPGPDLRRLFPLPQSAADSLNSALMRGQLSPRGADRVARVSWTVADLAGHDRPTRSDVLAALAHRDGSISWAA